MHEYHSLSSKAIGKNIPSSFRHGAVKKRLFCNAKTVTIAYQTSISFISTWVVLSFKFSAMITDPLLHFGPN